MNKLFFTVLFALCSLYAAASGRYKETINESWYYMQGDPHDAGEAFIDVSSWQQVNIPHCWNAIDSYKTKDYYRGPGWYRKTLRVPESFRGKKLYLRFDGASLRADVFVNGLLIGHHKGGYTAFSFDVSLHLLPGIDNVIAVRVDNSEQDIAPLSADFTFFGGMYRDVWLIATDEVHFDMDNMASPGVFIETPQVSATSANVLIRGMVSNKGEANRKVKVSHEIYDREGQLVTRETRNMNIKKDEKSAFNVTTKAIDNPHLWSPEDPYLYTVKSTITDARTNAVIDEMVNPLGFRWFSFDGATGFHLNGKPYKLNGICRHQDQQFMGSALSEEQHRRDMKLIKDLGANFIRISHYPQDDAILEQCDRLGLIAWEEIPIVNYIAPNETFYETCETQLREMIRQHYNHPCVMMWGYMNEIMLGTLKKNKEPGYEHLKQETARLARHLEVVLREEDKNRVSVVAQHENVPAYDGLGLSSISQVLGWNLYQGWYGATVHDFGRFMDEQHRLHPQRPHIISEYGAGSDIRIHSLKPECFDFSIEYQQYYTEEMLKQINDRPYIAGSSMWNFIDFGSAVREESMPHINNKGIVYADRTPKDVYYYYQAAWSKKPVLHIASRDWQNRTGVKLPGDKNTVTQPVKIYSNLQEAELIVNGKSMGRKTFTNCNAVWNVPFSDGDNTLIARSSKDGEVIEDVLKVNFKSQPFYISQPDAQLELGVNVGSTNYFTDDKSHFTWVPDKPYAKGSWGYVGGEIHRSNPSRLGIQSEIGGTHNQPLFQTLRRGLNEYRFDVPAGRYEIELSFADPQEKGTVLYDLGGGKNTGNAGARKFNVSINGNVVLENFDLSRQYNLLFAVVKRYIVEVTADEGISVKFDAIEGEPILNAIKLRTLL